MTDKKKKVSKKKTRKVSPMADEFLSSMVLKTAHGELTNAYLEEFKLGNAAWSKFPEADQAIVIDRCRRKAEHTLRTMFALVARKGFENTTAIIESVNFKKGAKITMNTSTNEGAHEMADRINDSVLIVFVDPKEYLNGEGIPEADKDQTSLV